MELIGRLNQLKNKLVMNGLENYVDLINETIEYIKAAPVDVKPTRDDFFPLEANAAEPIQIYGGNFYFGENISEKITDKLLRKNEEQAEQESNPPLVSEKNTQKF